MKGMSYCVRDYCLIRNHKVIQGDQLLFECNVMPPASFFTEIYKHFGVNYPKFYKMDNLCKLGFLAAELLLGKKNLPDLYAPYATGVVLFNASSSLDADRNHQKSIHDRSAYYPSPSVFVYTLANVVIGEICIRHKFLGEGIFFIEEKFDAMNVFTYVKQLLDDNIMQCCITGWVEVNGDQYEGILYLVEKSSPVTDGIVIFEPGKIAEIYSQKY
jgi:hypothetical protein